MVIDNHLFKLCVFVVNSSFVTNQSLCKWYRPSSHDDRVVWKADYIGDNRNTKYIQDQNQKNLGGIQSILYQDKLMTTLWHPSLTTTHSQPSQISIAFMNSPVCKSSESLCFHLQVPGIYSIKTDCKDTGNVFYGGCLHHTEIVLWPKQKSSKHYYSAQAIWMNV